MIKILQLVTKRQFRGAEVFASELSSLLGANGHDVIFAGLYTPGSSILEASNARNVDLNGTKSAFSFSLFNKLARLIREEKPAIIQANGSDTLKYAVFVKLFFFPTIPIVYRNISMVSSWAQSGSMKSRFNRLLFKKVNMVTSVGQQPLDDLVKLYHYPVNQARLIRRGIPEMTFDQKESRLNLSLEFGFHIQDPLVVHIGQFSDEKNHPFLINAFARVIDNLPSARLLLVGEGKHADAIRKMIADKNLQKHIFLTGHRSPVQEILSACDLFILGSTIEGVPGVILEAGMQAVPSIAVNVGGVGEVVKMNKTGVLIDKHDPVIFSDAIIHLLNNDEKRKNMGANAKAYVMENYSLKACLNNFEQLYADVLNSTGSKH